MTYDFPPDIADQLAAHLATGHYQSTDDVVRETFRALQDRDIEIAAINDGIEDLNAGRVRPLREFDAEFRSHREIG